jgi:hypothetical protein
LKVGLCKELENHIFDYGVHNAADLMRTTQEKIAQYDLCEEEAEEHENSIGCQA